MQRKLMFAALIVVVLVVAVTGSALAAEAMNGSFNVVVRSAEESLKLVIATTPVEPVRAYPSQPIGHYTCYFEGIRVPCQFLAWLWY